MQEEAEAVVEETVAVVMEVGLDMMAITQLSTAVAQMVAQVLPEETAVMQLTEDTEEVVVSFRLSYPRLIWIFS